MAPKELEKVLYFAASIVTWVDDEARQKDMDSLEKEVQKVLDSYTAEREERVLELRESLERREEYLQSGKQKGFNDDDHLWSEGLDINLKKLNDEDREKQLKDLRKTFDVGHLRHRGLHRGRRRAHAPGVGHLPRHEAEGRHRRRDRVP